ncbi:MAG: glycoside hydrolase family 13 protein, partial [Clostridiales bacterium]|nr:glycoside hydrolase family 13 protein [Clostridiales bacterium]
YGGDLKGVIDKMAYLRGLGVEAIYFNPVFVSPSNHKYDIQDYDFIDPHYGVIINDSAAPLTFEKFHNKYAEMYIKRTTDKENLELSNRLMARLIEIAHDNGIKVILDGVFNHCGAFNKWLDKEGFYNQKGYPPGAYREEDSPYNHYFKWYDRGWPNNDCYDSWWGHDNHPKLFFEDSKELYQYILDIGAKWVSPPFNADGWRLDVAADLGYTKEFNHRFWRDFRTAVKTANPDAIILAENYGDSSDWLKGDQWDTVMNYDAFMEPVTWFLTGMEKHSEAYSGDMFCNAMAFENAMRYHMARFSVHSLQTAMNQLSNHDHSRFMTRTNRTVGRLHTMGYEAADIGTNKGIMLEAVVMQMTWPGAPTVYYGDEAGLTGWTDPDNRRTFPWGREDAVLTAFHKVMIRLRKTHDALRTGSLEYLFNDYGILSYGRWNSDSRIIVAVNNNNEKKELALPVWKAEIALNTTVERVVATNTYGFDLQKERIAIKDGMLRITLPPYSSAVYVDTESAANN